MKRIFYILLVALVTIGYTSCQPDSFRKVYPEGNPIVKATLLSQEVLNYGEDSISFTVDVSETTTPLSTLSIKVIIGVNVIANEQVRTPDMSFSGTYTYAIPFGPNMPEGEPIKVYLTATNVEGTTTDVILSDCVGHRPTIETLYVMPPKPSTKDRGKQMQFEDDQFVLYDLGYPKKYECVLAVVGNKFGRIDWSYPVFGMINGEITLITEEQLETGEATTILLSNDNVETIDTIQFNPVTFELYYGGKVAQPISKLDVMNDLEEVSGKKYRHAKIFFDPELEVTISGVGNIVNAYNMDYMEHKGNDVVKFLAEKGMYDVYYFAEQDYIVVDPLVDAVYPNVMWVTGVGFGHPTAEPTTTGGWGFDNPGQYIACRTVAPKVYQFTAYLENGENADFADYGSLNFKFFHQKGWGGEELGGNYKQEGLNIHGVDAEGLTKLNGDTGCEKGNWIATKEPFSGVYRVTLDQNNMTTKYEKIR